MGARTEAVAARAGQVMQEAGVDPTMAAKTRVIQVPLNDPPKLAQQAASEEEALGHDRRVRDEIRRFVETLPGSLEEG